MEEVIERREFAKKNDVAENADRRLANRRLKPLGHLTAAMFLSIRHAARGTGGGLTAVAASH
jgi:hypothetical protein